MRKFLTLRAAIVAAAFALIATAVPVAAQFTFGPNVTIQEKMAFAGAPPVLTACGTTPTLAAGSTTSRGQITLGTTATGCVITFPTAYVIAPFCMVTWNATPLASQSYSTSTTALTLVQTSTSNNVVVYDCKAQVGF
jgi:hypothetical protein